MTFDGAKANIWIGHVGQKLQINVSHWREKQSLLYISLMKSITKTQACILRTEWILFLQASALSGPCHSRHDGGVVIVVPIWPHNELRARHRVTNRNMVARYVQQSGSKTNCAAVSIKDPAIYFWVSHFIILVLSHCHWRTVICPFTKLL